MGGDKDIEIASNQNTLIGKDETKNVKGNKKEIIQRTLDIQSIKEYSLSTQFQMNFNAKDNILFSTQESTSFESQKELSFVSDSTDIESN